MRSGVILSVSDVVSKTDEELVLLAREGSGSAMDELASRFFGIKRSGAGYLESADIIQESMFGFLSAVKAYDPSRGVPFRLFALKCMKNSANDAVGNVGREYPVDPDNEVLASGNSEHDPLERVIVSENLANVLGACEVELSALEKSVVFCHTSGMSYKEIGAKLGMGEKAVNNALQRARKKLKNALD